MYYDEEQYYEPSAFEELFMEYQQKMKSILLESIMTDIENIKKENIKLKEFNQNLRNQVMEIDSRERALKNKEADLTRQVKRQRLSELMKDFNVVMYKPDTTNVPLPKCDQCDKNRKLIFISPLGKTLEEKCSCAGGKIIYVPLEFICSEFKVNRDDNAMLMWYKENHEKDYDWYGYNNSDLATKVYKEGMTYEEMDSRTYFKSKEDCQKYCDWLNKNKV